MTQNDGPTKRILHVLDMLLVHGPMTLAEVAKHCAFSRAAVWRALDTLRANGWIRMRLGDNAFVVLPEKTRQSSAVGLSFPRVHDILPLMQRLEKDHAVHVCLGGIHEFRAQVLESTNKEDYRTTDMSFVRDGLAIAAQALLDNRTLLQLLRDYTKRCPVAERRVIEDGRHILHLRNVQSLGYFVSEDNTEVAVPLRLDSPGFAIRLRSKAETTLAVSSLVAEIGRLAPETVSVMST